MNSVRADSMRWPLVILAVVWHHGGRCEEEWPALGTNKCRAKERVRGRQTPAGRYLWIRRRDLQRTSTAMRDEVAMMSCSAWRRSTAGMVQRSVGSSESRARAQTAAVNCEEGGDRDRALGVKYGYGCRYYIEIAQSTRERSAQHASTQAGQQSGQVCD